MTFAPRWSPRGESARIRAALVAALADHPDATPAELGAVVGETSSRVARCLEQLERAGITTETRHGRAGRSTWRLAGDRDAGRLSGRTAA